jgi:hypothetical protein
VNIPQILLLHTGHSHKLYSRIQLIQLFQQDSQHTSLLALVLSNTSDIQLNQTMDYKNHLGNFDTYRHP